MDKLMENDDFKVFFRFADEFQKVFNEEKLKLPYHINVMDELYVNENSNSRILAKLLQFQNGKGEYEILESLLQYISGIKNAEAFQKICIKNPIITQEKERIDLWIRDKDYAIIFENKIYDAVDQGEQLSRYIEKTIAEGIPQDNIYVIYMPSYRHEPTEQSWGKYKDAFSDRFLILSFNDDIVAWLKNYVLLNVRQKDTYLYSALLQYIDYLEGYFSLRGNQKELNMALENLIVEHFELDGKTEKEQEKILNEGISNLNNMRMRMESVKEKVYSVYIEKKKIELKNEYKDFEIIEDKENDIFTIKIKDLFVFISNNGSYLCGASYPDADDKSTSKPPLCELKDWLPTDDGYAKWKNFSNDLDGFDEACKLFEKVVEICKKFGS